MLTTSPIRRLLLLLALCAVLLGAFGATVWLDNSSNRGITFTPAPTPIPWADGPRVGVNILNLHAEPNPAVVTRTLELARDMHAGYVRMQVPWEDIEIAGKGDFVDQRNDLNGDGVKDAISAWAKYDRIVDTARAMGLELVMRVERPPLWARKGFNDTPTFAEGLQDDGNSTGPPDHFADYGDFVHTLVARYKGKVRFFQIWNEPNLRNEWNWQDPKPEDFVSLLRIGYTAAKSANTDAVILFPSLAPTDGLDKRAPMTELEYLDRVYKAGGGAYFDIMSGQAYGLGQPPDEHRYVRLRGWSDWNWSRPIDTRNDVSRIVLLHEVMERNGDTNKAVWMGEFGWNSAPDTIPADRRFTWGKPVSEEQKGDYLVDMIERARREWPWVGVMNVWILRWGGGTPNPNDPTPYFALVDQDFNPLPAYTKLKAYLEQPHPAGVGYHDWTSWATPGSGGSSTLRFAGTGLDLKASNAAVAYECSVDDGAPFTASNVNNSGLLSVAHGLTDADHTLVVRPLASAPPPLAAVVSRTPPLPWLWTLAPALLLGLLALTGAATLQAMYEVADFVIERTAPARRRLLAWLASPAGNPAMLFAMLLALIVFYRASTLLPITALGLALFALLALVRPDLALRFVPLTVPLFFIPKMIWDARFGIRNSEGLRLPLHEVVLLVTVTAVAVQWMYGWAEGRRQKAEGRRQKAEGSEDVFAVLWEYAPVLLFLLAGTLGVVFAQPGGRGAALREWRWLIVEPVVFYALLCWERRQGDKETRGQGEIGFDLPVSQSPGLPVFLPPFLLGGAVVGLLGLLQFLGLNLVPLFGTKVGFSQDSIFVEGVQRVSSVYGHPNNLGLYMDRVWPLAVALAVGMVRQKAEGRRQKAEGRRQSSQIITGSWLGIAFCFLLAAFSVLGMLVSFSKGAWMGGVVAAGVLMVCLPLPARVRRLLLISGGVVLVLGSVAALQLGVERLNPFGESSGVRIQTWTSALAMIRDHPVFGIGLDQFGLLYPRYIDPALANTNEINTAHPHNLLLDIWLRMGLLGLVAFGWLLTRFFRRVRHVLRPLNPMLAAGCMAAMTAALVHGLVDSFYFWPDLAFAFWLLLAVTNEAVTERSWCLTRLCGSSTPRLTRTRNWSSRSVSRSRPSVAQRSRNSAKNKTSHSPGRV